MTRDSSSGFQVLVNTTAFCAEPITVTKGVYSCFDDGKLVDFDNTNYTQSWVYVNVASHDENSVELDLTGINGKVMAVHYVIIKLINLFLQVYLNDDSCCSNIDELGIANECP